ncbi:hypothetical protein FACS1894191_8290 [Clostridia bacterium]|nr:hypothetical protein FACS1894191_8290 [Clostridia bacterium]
MWAYDTTFYQLYTLGFCGAPKENDGKFSPRIRKVIDWIPHIRQLNAGAIYFCPVFSSDTHGYDTRDYRVLDERLGTNTDFADVCRELHAAGIKVVLDGVFNHVGRGFWAFQDVLKNREKSQYKDWFQINFGGNSPYNDGLWYEGWEGHFELVKLNLRNEAVVTHLFECISLWIREFEIDGLRLDVAYSLPDDFLQELRAFCDREKDDFFLLGEVLHGDYNRLMGDDKLHSTTNYQAYKGMWSSFNDLNMFEIAYTLEQHYSQAYAGKHLLSFVDNHDVERVASILKDPKHLPMIYGMLFGVPGIPCIYYGSEWGAEGKKQQGSDDSLRPAFDAPVENELSRYIARLAAARAQEPALCHGSYQKLLLTNRQLVFERALPDQRVIVAINADDKPFHADFYAPGGSATELIEGKTLTFSGGTDLAPYSVSYWRFPALEKANPLVSPKPVTIPIPVPAAPESRVAAEIPVPAAAAVAVAPPIPEVIQNTRFTDGHLVFESCVGGKRVLAAVNAGDGPFEIKFDFHGEAAELLSGKSHRLDGGYTLPAHSAFYWELSI